ncbi:hypothetical protein BGW38_002139 [Lunasporangiospora selenospora]|uniref:Uncharacterized protein n=1 Tax=Lunasporangiospora selenospora TaxID=979761 RepID=A0A9P6FST2_9FUNG|nr:hypothetical protein BGW38_002139 [Lunasporangiospora selenospora]
MTGFRAPFLNYSADTFTILGNQKFEYDSSTTATPADAHWPYTLDYGLANDCWDGICEQPISIPGLWEIPMAAIMDGPSTMAIPHNMDPQLDGTPEQKDRQPFGIYLHPVHVGNSTSLYTTFLNEIAALPNVWFVTNQQLLAWMKNPVPATQLADQPYMKCERPVVGKEICNGIEDSTVGVSVSVSASVSVNGDAIDARVLETCNFVAGAWSTCYGCPKSAPSAADPVPPRILAPGTAGARTPVPTTCAMEWWDPIAAQCLCTSSNCTFNDIAQTPKTTSGTGSGSGTNKGSDAVFLAPSLSAGLGVLAAVVAAGAAQWL